jgi:lipopolysaccharide/colanic/teichoic acid biosynthesis glycosyltransferase
VSGTTAEGLSVATAHAPAVTPRANLGTEIACRALDIVLCAVLLIALAPLLVAIALAVRLDSPGPSLFRQRRLGRRQSPFTIHKFRTMRDGVDHDIHKDFVLQLISGETPTAGEEGPRFKLNGDQRVTRLGRILRKTSLDELPQLWDVMRGHMSLVGPRPPIEYEVEHYPAHWFDRFHVKPGITGLWQVSGRSELTLEEMIALDIEYVVRKSFWLNLAIIARTVPVVISRKGAS